MTREQAIRRARWLERLPLCRIIWNEDGSPYLLRIYLFHILRSFFRAYFLHYFFRGDLDRELHNHPWDESDSWILFGGYIEERQGPGGGPIERRAFLPGDRNHLRANDFHRVDLIRPEFGCWTLFRAGKGVQSWGFRDAATLQYEPHQERARRFGLDPEN